MRFVSAKREQTRRWFLTELSQGPRDTMEVRRLASDAGISKEMLHNVKRDLDIETVFVEFGVWHWRLPVEAT